MVKTQKDIHARISILLRKRWAAVKASKFDHDLVDKIDAEHDMLDPSRVRRRAGVANLRKADAAKKKKTGWY